MRKFYLIELSLLLIFFTFVSPKAQTPNSTPPKDEEDVVKITTKLVQFDAVVMDKNGNQIKDLTAADFEILQDGKPQTITNLTYINTPNQFDATQSNKAFSRRTNIANAGRIITFVIDDGSCIVTPMGMFATRKGIEKFINEQMLPNDFIAIYLTRGGSSLLQQYTSDKTLLLRVARKIRWFPPPAHCGRPDINQDDQFVGAIGVLRYVVKGLEKISGRKLVFVLSDGIGFRNTKSEPATRMEAAQNGLADAANRASVVFETIDDRGVEVEIGTPASDETDSSADRDITRTGGLARLARETGGKFYKNNNFLEVPISRVLASETGYYLLAYEPEDETFKGKKFNKVVIKLKRPDLKIRSRSGFLSNPAETTKPKNRTEDSDLYDAIVTPILRGGLNLQLTAFFGNTADEGNFVRSLVHLDGNEITFVDDANGYKKAVFDVVAVTLNEKNEVVDEFNRTHTFKIEAAAIPLIKQNGLVYTTDVQVKKAGTYNFRIAVRDTSSRMLGSASQLIEVPNLDKDKIYLSGLTIYQVDSKGHFTMVSAAKPENAISLTTSTAVPSIRIFRRGTILSYAYTLYNAQLDKTTNQPKLSVQMKLYQDEKMISEGQPQIANLDKQADLKRIIDYGYLRLNQDVQPGDYTLQIIVKDLISNQTVSQTVDFEVAN